jgi:hypothetical protein
MRQAELSAYDPVAFGAMMISRSYAGASWSGEKVEEVQETGKKKRGGVTRINKLLYGLTTLRISTSNIHTAVRVPQSVPFEYLNNS